MILYRLQEVSRSNLERLVPSATVSLGNLRFKTTVKSYGWTSTRDLGWAFLRMCKSYGMAFCLPSCFTTVSFDSFSCLVKDQQRVTSKVRISYVTQRNNTFLFLFDLFSEFTSELRLFFKLVTLISFFCCFIFRVYEAARERKHGYPQWKYVSKPIVL